MTTTAKKWGVRLLKGVLILGIFAFLFAQAARNDVFGTLLNHEKRWGLLGLALLCNLATVAITFVRWRWLVLAMEMPLSYWDAFRLGFVGYLFNLAPAGMVSGDLVKVVLLARRYPEQKERAAAGVIVDRVIGLYVMFLVAGGAIWWTGFWRREEPVAWWSTQIILWLIIVSTVCGTAAVLPSMTRGRFRRKLARIPAVGGFLVKLVEAFKLYGKKPFTLLLSGLITFFVHIILALGVWCVAAGLFTNPPGVMDVQVAHPVANLTTMIPLAAGPYEAVLNELFALFPDQDGGKIGLGVGLIVALGYRITCVAVAGLGMVFYLLGRDEYRIEQEFSPGSQ